MSFSDFLEDELLDHVFAPAAYTAPANIYVKLHTGDPGEDGTANPAGETTRQEVTFGTASGGVISNDNTPQWTAYPNDTDDLTHYSLWDTVGPAGGNCLVTGVLSATKSPNIGDTVQFAPGDIDVSID